MIALPGVGITTGLVLLIILGIVSIIVGVTRHERRWLRLGIAGVVIGIIAFVVLIFGLIPGT